MPIGIKAELRDKKDHFICTLYKDIRKRLKISTSNILFIEVNDTEFMRIPNKDFHITIPKKTVKHNKRNINLKILGIYDRHSAKKRESILFQDNCMNIKAFIPRKTIFGHEIYVIDEGLYSYVWYPVGGGVKHLKIKNKTDYEKLSELIGFYFGDGNTSNDIRSFRLNNCESSTLNYCLDILEELGIKRSDIKVQIIYSSDKEINSKIKKRCVLYWSKTLDINRNQIVSVNRSKNKRETLKYGSARIFYDNSILVEVMLHGILRKFIEIVKNPRNESEKKITEGFFRGLLAAEGSPILERGSLRKVGISFNPHTNDLEFYKILLSNLDINWKLVHGNELIIQKFENFNKIYKLNGFKMHDRRNNKFTSGFRGHKYFKTKFRA